MHALRPLLLPGLAAVLSLACAAAAAQQPPASGPVPAGGTTAAERNVYLAGGQVRPAGPVAGDFAGAGGRVILDQPVGGDAAAIGGSVDVRAPVGDDLRAVGGDVTIEARIGGEVFASGGNITLTRQASVAHAARLYGANVKVDGRVEGPLQVAAQRVVIDGEVRGDARVTAEEVELGPAARIAGALIYSAGELKRDPAAVVGGAVTRDEHPMPGERPMHPRPPQREGASWAGSLFAFLGLLACAAVFVGLAPGFAAAAAERLRASPWASLGLGFALLLAVPVLCVLLFVTVLGIPLGLLVMSLYPALLLLGLLVGVVLVGRLIPRGLRKAEPAAFAARMGYLALALGLLVLLMQVPFVGGLLVAALTLAGMGAIALDLHQRRNAHRAGRVALPPAA